MRCNILIVDDEPGLRKGLGKILSLQKYRVFEASNGKEAGAVLENTDVDLILLDLKLGAEDGFELLKQLKTEEPFIPIIVITGFGNIKDAVACLKAGAINYITKPIDKELLLPTVQKEILSARLQKENIGLKESLKDYPGVPLLASRHPALEEINFVIHRVRDSAATVLILGESGTGKEVTAQLIHYSGQYKTRPFVGVNCAALNDNLLESELFGHERGAFTGAIERKLGRFELAGDGTLFLDEVGDMSLAMQAKLLRVLQERSFERVGGTKSLRTQCRVLASSNKDLKKMIADGNFREDLYYRLSLVVIHLPPLRERTCDIESLTELFIQQANREYDRSVKGFAPKLMERLKKYPWPGNIRQLKNVVTNAVILSRGDAIRELNSIDQEIDSEARRRNYADNVFAETREQQSSELGFHEGLRSTTARYVAQLEKEAIGRALTMTARNMAETARVLRITRKTLYEKIRKYAL